MKRFLLYTVLVFLFIGAYLIRYFMVRHSYPEGALVRVTGQISSDPTMYESQQRVEVGAFRFYVPRYPEFSYGDKIVVEGKVGKGSRRSLRRNGRGWELKDIGELREVGVTENPLNTLRRKVLEIYRSTLPEPHSALLAGIVLGTKSSLDSSFFEALRKTSTLHVVVASGTNVSFLAGGVMASFASFVGRRKAILLALSLVWLYVLLIGLQPPIIRAAIMGTIGFVALGLGREAWAFRALVLSAGLMLLMWPDWLFDLGFQLSFLATLGVIGLGGRLGRLGMLGRFPGTLRESVSTSLGAQIAVAPLLYFNFGEVSWIGPFANMLVLWTIPFIMAGGALIGLIGLMGPIGALIAQISAWVIWLPLEYFIRVVQIFNF